MSSVQVIEASGPPTAIGETIGRALAVILLEAITRHRQELARHRISWDLTHDLARRLRDDLERNLPKTAEELAARARATGVDVDTLISLNALQETLFLARRICMDEGCTSLAVPAEASTDGSVLLAHNEDALPCRHEQVYVLRVQPADEPSFRAFAYSGLFFSQGVNEVEIGSAGNALPVTDIRIGVPKLFLYREVLRASTLAGAIQATLLPERANGNNHLIATAAGEISEIEVTWRHDALHYGGNGLFSHANYVLAPERHSLEEGDILDSQLRRNRGQRLLTLAAGQHTVETLQALLRDHANQPNALCKHLDPAAHHASRTIAGLVIDVTKRELWAAPGAPCRVGFEGMTLA
ncbi:MAG: C45 family autoproteolytic acyltransferase/hydrolase [Thermomicrobium sp.]